MMHFFLMLLLVASGRGFRLPLRHRDDSCVDAVLVLQQGRPSPSLESAATFVEFTAAEVVESLASDVNMANRCIAQHSLYYAAMGGVSNPPVDEVQPCWFNKTAMQWTTRACCNYQDWEAGATPSVFCAPRRCRSVIRDVFFGYYNGGYLSGAPTTFGPPPDAPPALSRSRGVRFQSMILDASAHVQFNGTFFKAAYNATAHKEFLATNQMASDIVYLRDLFPATVDTNGDGERAPVSPYDEVTRFLFVIDAAGEPCNKVLERHPGAASLVRTLRVLTRATFEE